MRKDRDEIVVRRECVAFVWPCRSKLSKVMEGKKGSYHDVLGVAKARLALKEKMYGQERVQDTLILLGGADQLWDDVKENVG